MGMFDNILVDEKLLPLSDEEKKLLYKTKSGLVKFQSKDLDCELIDFEIAEQSLFETPFIVFGEDFSVTKKRDFHGCFNFYTTNKNKQWIEFTAKFTDGILQHIKQIVK